MEKKNKKQKQKKNQNIFAFSNVNESVGCLFNVPQIQLAVKLEVKEEIFQIRITGTNSFLKVYYIACDMSLGSFGRVLT